MPPLTAQLVEVIWWLSFVTISILVAAGIGWRKYSLYLEMKRMHQLVALGHYHQRLQLVTSEMLALADELDQKLKYIPSNLSATSNKKLGIACEELVKLGEMLPLLEQLIEHKNVKDSREGILQSCRMASKISKELQAIRMEEPKLLDDKKSDKKRQKNPNPKRKNDSSSESK